MLLIYAIYKQDIVFTFGQSSGLFIYLRNLQLIRNEQRRISVAATAPKAEIIQVTATVQQRKAA